MFGRGFDSMYKESYEAKKLSKDKNIIFTKDHTRSGTKG